MHTMTTTNEAYIAMDSVARSALLRGAALRGAHVCARCLSPFATRRLLAAHTRLRCAARIADRTCARCGVVARRALRMSDDDDDYDNRCGSGAVNVPLCARCVVGRRVHVAATAADARAVPCCVRGCVLVADGIAAFARHYVNAHGAALHDAHRVSGLEYDNNDVHVGCKDVLNSDKNVHDDISNVINDVDDDDIKTNINDTMSHRNDTASYVLDRSTNRNPYNNLDGSSDNGMQTTVAQKQQKSLLNSMMMLRNARCNDIIMDAVPATTNTTKTMKDRFETVIHAADSIAEAAAITVARQHRKERYHEGHHRNERDAEAAQAVGDALLHRAVAVLNAAGVTVHSAAVSVAPTASRNADHVVPVVSDDVIAISHDDNNVDNYDEEAAIGNTTECEVDSEKRLVDMDMCPSNENNNMNDDDKNNDDDGNDDKNNDDDKVNDNNDNDDGGETQPRRSILRSALAYVCGLPLSTTSSNGIDDISNSNSSIDRLSWT